MSVTRARRPTAVELAAIVDGELRRAGDRARAEGEKRYLKSDLTFYGVGRPGIRRIVGAVLEEHAGSAGHANSREPARPLREVAKKRPALVVDWLLPRARRASGVTRREAVKYLPAPDRDRILRASTK